MIKKNYLSIKRLVDSAVKLAHSVLMHEKEDELILDLILRQHKVEAGYRMMLDQYQEKLYWHIRRMVLNHEDADDVLQNTLIKIFRNLAKFKGESKLYTWMYRIASNETLTFLRSRRRRQTDDIDEHTIEMGAQLKADPFFDGDETLRQLYMVLETLPDKQKQVFHLKYFDDMKYEEMSELLNTSVGALKASYHHATKKVTHYFKTTKIG